MPQGSNVYQHNQLIKQPKLVDFQSKKHFLGLCVYFGAMALSHSVLRKYFTPESQVDLRVLVLTDGGSAWLVGRLVACLRVTNPKKNRYITYITTTFGRTWRVGGALPSTCGDAPLRSEQFRRVPGSGLQSGERHRSCGRCGGPGASEVWGVAQRNQ